MAFLASSFLWGMAAVSIPIIVHLIKRQRARKILFSHLRFLGPTAESQMVKNRWRQWLLLACRVAALLLLALAFARPVWRSVFAREGEDVVFILDTSYSLGYGGLPGESGRFQEAKKILSNRLAKLGRADRSLLLTAADHVKEESGWTFQHIETGAAAERAVLTYRSSSFGPALAKAAALLASSSARPRVVVVTDGQALGWTRVSMDRPLGKNLQVEILSTPPPGDNMYVASAHFDRPPSGVPILTVRVASSGTETYQDLPVEVEVEGRSLMSSRIDLVPGIAQDVRLSWPTGRPLPSEFSVKAGSDNLAIDNIWHVAVQQRPEIRVWAVEDGNRRSVYLDAALRSLEDVGRFTVRRVAASDAASLLTREAPPHAMILADIAPLANAHMTEIEKAVKEGMGLMVFCGDRWDAAWGNRSVGSWMPAQLIKIDESPTTVAGWAPPLDELFQDVHATPWRVTRQWMTRPHAEAKALAVTSRGHPLLLARKHGAGWVNLWAAGSDRAWGEAVIHPFFVPVQAVLIHQLCGGRSLESVPVVGRPWRVEWEERGDLPVVKGPEGPALSSSKGLQAVAHRDGPFVVITGADRPGVYEVSGGSKKTSVAVNLPVEESELVTCDLASVTNRLSDTAVSPGVSPALSQEDLVSLEARQRGWWYVMVGLLGLLLAELWLAQRTYA